MKPDPIAVRDSIAKMMQKAKCPLTETQKLLLVGALAVWLEKAGEEGK